MAAFYRKSSVGCSTLLVHPHQHPSWCVSGGSRPVELRFKEVVELPIYTIIPVFAEQRYQESTVYVQPTESRNFACIYLSLSTGHILQ